MAAGAAAVAAGAAAVVVWGVPPIAATALRQFGESCAELRCRQRNASAPPGCTPEHFAIKSDWHNWRIAACCCAVGRDGAVPAAAVAAAAGFGAAAGFAVAAGRVAG